MSERRTLVLDDEEAPTIADFRYPRSIRLPEKTHSARAALLESPGRARLAVGASFVLVVSLGLLGVALQERRNSYVLGEILEELQRSREAAAETRPVRPSGEPLHRSNIAAERPVLLGSVAGSARELESKALSALLANDYRGSVALYRELMRVAPRKSVFSDLVTILEAKLGCSARGELSGPSCP
jgi:hypothetical protein